MSHTNRLLRRAEAAIAYRDLKQRAAKYGMSLTKYSDSRYQLLHVQRRWLMDIYPAARSAYWVPCTCRSPGDEWPVLHTRNWSLTGAVETAIEWARKETGS